MHGHVPKDKEVTWPYGVGGQRGHSSAQNSLFGIYMALVDVTLKGLVSGVEQNTTAPPVGTDLRG